MRADRGDNPRKGWPQESARLFRNFVTLCAIVAAAILLVSLLGLRFVFRAGITAEAEKDAIHISKALCNAQVRAFVQEADDKGKGLEIPKSALVALDREMRSFLAPFQIIKIKIFTTDTRIIYTTDSKIIGKEDKENVELLAALGGSTV